MPDFKRVAIDKVDLRTAVAEDIVADYPVFVKCINPRHNDQGRPNMAVYIDHVYCYACRFFIASPSRMEALAALLGYRTVTGRWDWKKALTVAEKYTVEGLDNYRRVAARESRRDPMPRSLAEVYFKTLMQQRAGRIMWLLERGLTMETIIEYQLGHDGTRFTIPLFGLHRNEDDTIGSTMKELHAIRFRRDDFYGTETWDGHALPKYSGLRGRNGLYLYPEVDCWRDDAEYLVVCEGELDALRLRQGGINACSPTNGVGNLRHVPQLLGALGILPRLRRIYIASDMDEPGEAGAAELDLAIDQENLSVMRLRWDAAHKDVTEWLQAGHTLEEAGFKG